MLDRRQVYAGAGFCRSEFIREAVCLGDLIATFANTLAPTAP
jgi:hypothetical protein